MDPRRLLYTRQQLGEIAGLDDTTLNYWSREGILRPVEGGGGRGQHRRFAYYEVNLAALLGQLRNFGVSAPALKQLAGRFHDAIDWFETNGIGRSSPYWESAFDLFLVRKRIVKDGYFSWRVSGDDRFPDMERHPDGFGGSYVHMDWPQAVAFYRNRDPEHADLFNDKLVAQVEAMDLAAYDEHRLYYQAITGLNHRKPDEEVSTEPDYFYRTADGSWAMHPDRSLAAREAVSFIGVDMERLSYLIWHGK